MYSSSNNLTRNVIFPDSVRWESLKLASKSDENKQLRPTDPFRHPNHPAGVEPRTRIEVRALIFANTERQSHDILDTKRATSNGDEDLYGE